MKSNTNIVAVIPARSGSKGIPGKNIRTVCGKPLVSYSISTALASNATHVIVSTDSDDVKRIAEDLGADVIWRDRDLCGDDVTLDPVVDSATRDMDDCIVVTMQPTSPCLTADTLDSALWKFIGSDYDTMISVIDDPRLSWKTNGGITVPCYSQRMNRQWLPHEYAETGAFVMSRKFRGVPLRRFGASIGTYVIPEWESVDIDSVLDLAAAEYVLSGMSDINERFPIWIK